MFEVQVPASTTNLGSGFDVAGMAVNLYNVFQFEEAEETSYFGFLPIFSNDKNLVYYAYKYVFDKCQKEVIPVKISLVRNEIPLSRGLGSSSSCIIAGVVAANKMLGEPYTLEECLAICNAIEGHPDNVSASLFGGLTTSFVHDGEVYVSKVRPHNNLRFVCLIPDYQVSTKEARKVLKQSYSKSEIVFSMSRAVHLKDAFMSGNLEFISKVMEDKIHVPYRKFLIPGYESIQARCKEFGFPLTISGSGSTLFCVMTKQDDLDSLYSLHELDGWRIAHVEVDLQGTRINEVIK
ncbi:MAG: homoserine kinase [Candidatus Izemoplasmatales bacterium]